MTAIRPSDAVYPRSIDHLPSIGSSMRTDIETMLNPFFPEAGDAEVFETKVGDHHIRIASSGNGLGLPGPADRKLLNFLSARIGDAIRAGDKPDRHVELDMRDLVEATTGECVHGGAEYQRLHERFQRLMDAKITTTIPIGNEIEREHTFRWIDGYERDVQRIPGERRTIRVRVTLSEVAFRCITRAQGFDLPREDFQLLTSSRSSVWRIYEICLAQLLCSPEREVCLPIDELRQRVPIHSELKVFKSRTLKAALAAMERSPQMARNVAVEMVKKTDGGFEPMTGRVPLEQVYIRVRPGNGPLPRLNRLLPAHEGSKEPPSNSLHVEGRSHAVA